MKKTKSFPYVIFTGETKNDLYPVGAAPTKEEAISRAKALALLGKVKPEHKCAEAVYMPEDDDDTNEVVWSNCGRK